MFERSGFSAEAGFLRQPPYTAARGNSLDKLSYVYLRAEELGGSDWRVAGACRGFEISLDLLFFFAAVLKPRTVRVLPPDFCELPPEVYHSLALDRSVSAIMSRMSRST